MNKMYIFQCCTLFDPNPLNFRQFRMPAIIRHNSYNTQTAHTLQKEDLIITCHYNVLMIILCLSKRVFVLQEGNYFDSACTDDNWRRIVRGNGRNDR